MSERKRTALLIDCDNVSNNSIEGVLEELAKYGMVNVRHAHGDWNNPSLSGWIDRLHSHTIRPIPLILLLLQQRCMLNHIKQVFYDMFNYSIQKIAN